MIVLNTNEFNSDSDSKDNELLRNHYIFRNRTITLYINPILIDLQSRYNNIDSEDLTKEMKQGYLVLENTSIVKYNPLMSPLGFSYRTTNGLYDLVRSTYYFLMDLSMVKTLKLLQPFVNENIILNLIQSNSTSTIINLSKNEADFSVKTGMMDDNFDINFNDLAYEYNPIDLTENYFLDSEKFTDNHEVISLTSPLPQYYTQEEFLIRGKDEFPNTEGVSNYVNRNFNPNMIKVFKLSDLIDDFSKINVIDIYSTGNKFFTKNNRNSFTSDNLNMANIRSGSSRDEYDDREDFVFENIDDPNFLGSRMYEFRRLNSNLLTNSINNDYGNAIIEYNSLEKNKGNNPIGMCVLQNDKDSLVNNRKYKDILGNLTDNGVNALLVPLDETIKTIKLHASEMEKEFGPVNIKASVGRRFNNISIDFLDYNKNDSKIHSIFDNGTNTTNSLFIDI